MRKSFIAVFSLFVAASVYAQDATTKSEEKKSPFTFSGYVDTYFFGNLNSPKSKSNLGASGYERAFDQKVGQFQVGLVQTKMTYSTDKVDGVIDLTFGNHGDLGNYGNALGRVLVGGKEATGTALAIKQAYLTWKATDKLSITAGQWGTHIGYEVIDAPVNYNYSLSNLFNNGPFYHTGVKATVATSAKSSLTFGLVNGVDSKDDNNDKLGYMGQFYVSPATGWNLYVNWIGSEEPVATDGSMKFYSLLDLTTSYQITEKFLLGVNAAYGTQNKLSWGGAAVYAQISLSDKFGLGARYEYFDNKDGARYLLNADGNGTSVNSFTFTGNVIISDNLLFKPEFRLDSYAKAKSGDQQFEDKDGNFTKNSQSTFGGALIFKF
jgi:hypothetical protein